MATANPQGIMALPAEGAPAQPQLGLDDSYDAVQQGLQNASPDAYAAVNDELSKLAPQLDQLPDDVLDQLLQIIQYMHDNPKEYTQCLKELVDSGIISEGDFPEEYDPEFLATMGMVIMQARKTRQGAQGAAPVASAPMPPVGMARGGIAEAAHLVASKGRGKDTMLAHITPKEAKMLRAKGGMGTINPATGLPEYGWFSNAVKSVGRAIGGTVKSVANVVSNTVKNVASTVKTIVSSPIGKVLATVALATFIGPGAFGVTGLGLGTTASMALASGAVTALGGGSIKDVLKSAAIGGATAFFGAPGGAVSNFVGGAVTNAAANAAITSGIVGTGIGLLSGQKLQDAVKSGITAGAISGLTTGATKGFNAQINAPEAPTVGSELSKNQPTPQQLEANVQSPEGATSSPVRNLGDVQGQPLPPASSNYAPVQNADGTTTAFLGRAAPDASGQPPSVTYGNAPAAPVSSPDVLGDFIAQNDAARELANTPAAGGPAGDGSYKPPTFGRAYDEFGRGEYGNAAKTVFMPESPTPSQVTGSQEYQDLVAKGISPDKALDLSTQSMSPGLLRTYGPATAAGLGIAGLAGAFTPKPPEPTPLQNDINQRLADERARVAANPGAYVPQGLEQFGIQYNDRGEIIGSQPWNPAPSAGTTEVAGNYMPYQPSPYMTPTGAIGGTQPMYQPFNTASMYTNLMPPQYRADGGAIGNVAPPSSVMRDMGGIASLATGGYPRRTGPISGPGTETSDSIPAMLSDGEFVMTAKAVRGAGKGNRLAGAKKMYALMHQLERNAARG